MTDGLLRHRLVWMGEEIVAHKENIKGESCPLTRYKIIFPAIWRHFALPMVDLTLGAALAALLICHFRRVAAQDVTTPVA